MSLRRAAVVAALCGTTAVVGWLALARFDFGVFHAAAAPVEDSLGASATAEVPSLDAGKGEDAFARDDAPIIEPILPVSIPSPEVASPQVATVPALDPAPSPAQEPTPSLKMADDCHLSEACIDRYLWLLYERTPKLDTIKVSERVKT